MPHPSNKIPQKNHFFVRVPPRIFFMSGNLQKKPRYESGFLQKRGMTAKFFAVIAILIIPISQQEIIA